jgi:hypothetical protein
MCKLNISASARFDTKLVEPEPIVTPVSEPKALKFCDGAWAGDGTVWSPVSEIALNAVTASAAASGGRLGDGQSAQSIPASDGRAWREPPEHQPDCRIAGVE